MGGGAGSSSKREHSICLDLNIAVGQNLETHFPNNHPLSENCNFSNLNNRLARDQSVNMNLSNVVQFSFNCGGPTKFKDAFFLKTIVVNFFKINHFSGNK